MPKEGFPRHVFSVEIFRDSVSFNVPEARLCSETRDAQKGSAATPAPQESTLSSRKKIRAQRVALSLPQDFACSRVIARCALSSSIAAGFWLDPIGVS
jgi:hypothetical protein